MSVTQQQPSPIGETVFDDSDLRRYRTELPNIIDDLGLSLCAYRLYGHYKRVAGSGGVCFQSNRTIAAACKMSVGSVVNARKELAAEREELGGASLITVSKRGSTGSEYVNVRIVDIWEYNMRRYAVRSDRSLGEGGCSPHEQGVQNVITKKELKLRTNSDKKKEKTDSLSLLPCEGQTEEHGTNEQEQTKESVQVERYLLRKSLSLPENSYLDEFLCDCNKPNCGRCILTRRRQKCSCDQKGCGRCNDTYTLARQFYERRKAA